MADNSNNNNNGPTDEEVSQFLTFTGTADPSQAASYFEMSGGDLQTAVSLYLEHGAGGPSNSATSTGAAAAGGGGGPSTSGSGPSFGDDPNMDVRAPDATRTMRLMDFEDGGPSSSRGGPMIPGILARAAAGDSNSAAAALMGAFQADMDNMGGSAGRDYIMNNAFAASLDEDETPRAGLGGSNAAVPGGASGGTGTGTSDDVMPGDFRDIINRAAAMDSQNDSDSLDTDVQVHADSDVEVVDENNNTSSARSSRSLADRARTLGNMFEAPIHLIYDNGGFQGARTMAKDSKRWLLINLQSDSDFACHALNRDVWGDELVENLVREGFIFWQSTERSPDGRTYAQRYNVTGYPHVSIIDPRTGRLMWKKEGWTAQNPMTPQMFAEVAADFCSRHSFDKDPSAPVPVPPRSLAKSGGNGINNSVGGNFDNNTSSERTSGSTEMTEEEQLEAAIRASMNESGGPDGDNNNNESYDMDMDDDSNDSDVVCIDDQKIPPETSESQKAQEEDRPPTFEEEIVSMEVADEPSGTTGVARIMIRMPDGKRLVRKFSSSDTVKTIYAFVAQSNEDAKGGKAFECKAGFPPKDLRTSVDQTIDASGLAGDTITVRWKS